MKLKTMLAFVCLFFLTNLFAANVYLNPNANASDQKAITKNSIYPGFCQIELINDSYTDLYVYGTFDDGVSINFSMYRFETAYYISLFYYLYCHSGMYITIQSPFGVVYSGWTNVDTTIHVVPYLKNSAKAELSVR